jgi:selenide,water dikinase
MSDIYAMGGDVMLALNIAAFPDDLPTAILAAIIDGGASKVAEAGGVIAGGHTVSDPEPKYGLAVTGRIRPDRILTKAGAKPGDRLYLTKALGTGALTTAMKNQAIAPDQAVAAIESMLRLNRRASEVAREIGINACTDITGFGLLGHAGEIAAKSRVRLDIAASAIPWLPGAIECARAGQLPGGVDRNREHFSGPSDHGATVSAKLDPAVEALLFDPETSGPLLLSVPPTRSGAMETMFGSANLPLWQIGEVRVGSGVLVRS